MIRIDPVQHLEIVAGIVQSKYLPLLFFALAVGMGIPPLAAVMEFLIRVFLYGFPFYLLFTLAINRKTGWAAGLVVWMLLSLVPGQLGTDYDHLRYLYSWLPFLFLVLYCVVLNLKLRDWGFRESGRFPLWF